MDMDRDNLTTNRTETVYDRDTTVYDRDRGGSNFLAFLIGGLVIAVGLLAFLFYDGGTTEPATTGSTTTMERPTTAPTTPSTPTSPARPANPQ
jgi:hypothetical protein